MNNRFFDRERLRHTLRTGQLLLMIETALIAACCFQLLSSLNPYYTGLLLFFASLGMLLIFITGVVQKGLTQQKHSVWKLAIAQSALACLTPALPFAVLSLRELFDHKTREEFFGTKTSHSQVAMTTSTKMVLAIFSAMVLLASVLFFQFQKKAVFFDVAFSNPAYNLAPNLSVAELYGLGAECNYEGRTQCSIAAFLEILKKRPGETRALLNLAMAQSHVGEYKASVYNFEKAFQMGAPLVYDAAFHYGKALFGDGKLQRAKSQFAKVIDMEPLQSEAAAQMVLTYIEEKNYTGALKFISAYTKTNPKAIQRFSTLNKRLKRIISRPQ